MSSGIDVKQDQVLEGEIVDEGYVHFTAHEQQRFVNLTHAMVFLKKDAHLAEICARKAHHLMRQHLRECYRALYEDANIYKDIEYQPSTEFTTKVIDL